LFPETESFAILFRTFSTPLQWNVPNNTTVLFVIQINWKVLPKLSKVKILVTVGQESERVYMKDRQAFLRGTRR
jgi:hypothetical protein